MNAQQIAARWPGIRTGLKERWARLNDADLDLRNGNIDATIAWIAKKTGETQDRVEAFIAQLAEQAQPYSERLRGSVQTRPALSVAIAFSAGLGFGLALGLSLGSR